MAAGMQMNVLLDTCALLALAGNSGKLPEKAAEAIALAPSVAVSVVSVWEIAIKVKTGRLHLGKPVLNWYAESLSRYHLDEIPLPASLICAAADLPLLHRDPFDRVLVATAMDRGLVLLTSDRVIPTYPGVRVIW
jgi:PIN domain nuclease of toxin-antitoxin system